MRAIGVEWFNVQRTTYNVQRLGTFYVLRSTFYPATAL